MSARGQEFAPALFGFAPRPDLLPQSLKWPLFCRKRSLDALVELGGYEIFRPRIRRRSDKGAARDEGLRILGRLAKVENQRGRFRAEEFWDRVMQEIAELIAERGPLTPDEIFPELRTSTVRGAALHQEPLTAGALRKKMDVRVTHRRYFEAPVEGRYARRNA
ncbi:hypothetical protein M2440_002204 [Methylorubrum extorquens]|nr:hypothetical protein [Methylorubrum extorquens]